MQIHAKMFPSMPDLNVRPPVDVTVLPPDAVDVDVGVSVPAVKEAGDAREEELTILRQRGRPKREKEQERERH
jgi:hypothetical protein